MLEQNLSILDNDFITLWSRFLLNQDKSKTESIAEQLKCLAELGQKNAIQAFLFLERNPNQTINKFLNISHKDVSNNNYEDLILLSAISFNKNKDFIKAKKNEFKFVQNKTQEVFLKTFYYLAPSSRALYQKRDELWQELQNLDYIKLMSRANTICKNLYKETNNVLYLQRSLEIESEVGLVPEKIKRTRKSLIKKLKEEPNNIMYQFALGKHIKYFSSSQKDKEIGSNLLKKLASRQFSPAFAKYIEDKNNSNFSS